MMVQARLKRLSRKASATLSELHVAFDAEISCNGYRNLCHAGTSSDSRRRHRAHKTHIEAFDVALQR